MIAIEGLEAEWTHSWTLIRTKVTPLMKQLLWFDRMLIVHIKWLQDTMLWLATVQRWCIPNFNWEWISWLYIWGGASWELNSRLYWVIIIYALHYSESIGSDLVGIVCSYWSLVFVFCSFGQKLMGLDTLKTWQLSSVHKGRHLSH